MINTSSYYKRPDVIPAGSEVTLPFLPELLGEIFKQCHLDDLGNLSLVNTLWNREVNKIEAQGLCVFGVEAWKELSFPIEGEVPPIPSRLNQIARTDQKRFEGQNGAINFTAILMPKGLTLNKMLELMKQKKIQHGIIWDKIVDKFGDQAIEESYWVLMTNDLIKGSEKKNCGELKDFFVQKSRSQYRLPTLLETIVHCVMNLVKHSTYLGRSTSFCTLCQEDVDNFGLSVGFSANGIFVNALYIPNAHGVVGSRKFPFEGNVQNPTLLFELPHEVSSEKE